MPLYRVDTSGRFVPLERVPFPDLERVLEDWIERNPHALLEGENVAVIARQPRTEFGKYLDLLGIDQSGACVVVELKRGEAPRDVIAQALEYAAWVDSLSLDQLDDLARSYAAQRGVQADGVAGIYRRAFPLAPASDGDEDDGAADDADGGVDGEAADLADRITVNHRQGVVVVAERFAPETEQTLRYLRARLGVDVTGVRIGVHRAGADTVIETEVIVGREPPRPVAARRPGGAANRESDEAIAARVKTDFLRRAVTGIEDWIEGLANPAVEVRHGAKSEHWIRIRGRDIRYPLYYRYDDHWLTCYLYDATPEEIGLLESRLIKPTGLKDRAGGAVSFHVVDDADLELVKEILLHRIAAPRAPSGGERLDAASA